MTSHNNIAAMGGLPAGALVTASQAISMLEAGQGTIVGAIEPEFRCSHDPVYDDTALRTADPQTEITLPIRLGDFPPPAYRALPAGKGTAMPVNRGKKNLSPKRVAKRHARNKAARKSRR